jgi:hypothetical protein
MGGISGVKFGGYPPVFDRGSFEPVGGGWSRNLLGSNNTGNGRTGSFPRYRTEADRIPAREIVTSRILKDPSPERAGRAPDCEDSRRLEIADQVSRLLGRRVALEDIDDHSLEAAQAEIDRLAPRRWRANL